ncbi:MAG: HAMP domain-containing histidine kinase [Gammaproteobacteria bacterium]|nr:HAMP domain-containing histidine kinase [Gammaproteobacteria bacterium]NNL51100.1 HAMP domain-containing histidine kinase [Woeseiaceae bacterium]
MRSLFWKLFGAFWLTTLVILAVSIFVSFRIADQQSPYSFADPREIDEQLQAILQLEGIEGLEDHIANRENFPPGQTVYLIDSNGRDLLGRTLPERVHSRARRIWSSISEHRRERRDRRESDRRSRWLRQSLLVTADGRMLLAMPGPAPQERFGFLLAGNGRWAVLGLAAAISLLSFWLLSRSLARPVARISDTAARLAGGDMTSRVGKNAYTHDEIGQLAAQFDRMAEELDQQSRTRLEMFRNIAHELRAPLTRLQIATELLQRKPDSSPQQLERIRYEIERVEALASQVLALARAERLPDSEESTSLAEVVKQVIADAGFEAGARGVRVECPGPGTDIVVKGNPDVVSSAIENVVRNAIQHTPSGGEVVVTTTDGAPGTVTVTDGGPGVPAKDLDKIFEPFFRIDTNRPGAGIGLAITKRVLQQLGGTLNAVNRQSGGLRITMRFPLSRGTP